MKSSFVDQIGHSFALDTPAKKIISLVPSQSELLWDLGLQEQIVGITKFCIHPNEMFRNVKRVGGTKNVNFDVVKELAPDLIVANKEENTESEIRELQKHYNVYTSDISNLKEALEMMVHIGEMTARENEVRVLTETIQDNFSSIAVLNSKPRALYLIWQNPYMSIGANSFINFMMQKMGFINVLDSSSIDYPEITTEQIRTINPDLILLSSEPFPFKEKHLKEFKTNFPNARIELVDGEMFSWYGLRLRLAPAYLNQLASRFA